MKLLFTTMYPLFIVTALITHFWTALIAYQAGGSTSALLTLFLPLVSELYWVSKTVGHDDIYACITVIHLAVSASLALFYAKSYLQNIISKTH